MICTSVACPHVAGHLRPLKCLDTMGVTQRCSKDRPIQTSFDQAVITQQLGCPGIKGCCQDRCTWTNTHLPGRQMPTSPSYLWAPHLAAVLCLSACPLTDCCQRPRWVACHPPPHCWRRTSCCAPPWLGPAGGQSPVVMVVVEVTTPSGGYFDGLDVWWTAVLRIGRATLSMPAAMPQS